MPQNLFTDSEDFAAWTATGGAVLVTSGAPDPGGGSTGGSAVQLTAGQGLFFGIAVAAGALVATSLWVRVADATPGTPANITVADAFGGTNQVDTRYYLDGAPSAAARSIVDANWHHLESCIQGVTAGMYGLWLLAGSTCGPVGWAWPVMSYGRRVSPYARTDGAEFNPLGRVRGFSGQRVAVARAAAVGRVALGGANLFARSEELSHGASWVPFEVTVGAAVAGPTAGVQAWPLIPSSNPGVHFLQGAPVVDLTREHAYSAVVRPVVSPWVLLADSGANMALFNCLTGAVSYTNNARDGLVEPLGGGWYRLSALIRPASSGDSRIYVLDAAGNVVCEGDDVSTAFECTQLSCIPLGRGPYVHTPGAAVSTAGRLFGT